MSSEHVMIGVGVAYPKQHSYRMTNIRDAGDDKASFCCINDFLKRHSQPVVDFIREVAVG